MVTSYIAIHNQCTVLLSSSLQRFPGKDVGKLRLRSQAAYRTTSYSPPKWKPGLDRHTVKSASNIEKENKSHTLYSTLCPSRVKICKIYLQGLWLQKHLLWSLTALLASFYQKGPLAGITAQESKAFRPELRVDRRLTPVDPPKALYHVCLSSTHRRHLNLTVPHIMVDWH